MKSSNDIRQDFLQFFQSKGHQIVASSPLVPGNDPTLLFTNAGMVQFKDVFLGGDKRSYARAVSSQRCVRAGGKHNDLDQVGYTARHHTFFEMLGNFSFGDYFKKDAICWAWELLTEVWKLPKERLLVTIYHTDDEAFEIWHKDVGIPADRIIRIGDNKGAPYASDNFWQMADTGPCGPCTEIFYDHGAHIAGGPPGSPDEDGDRFIEIWNNVFMQFDRQPDGSLQPLPAPCVDTGMGLERVSAVLQHVHSNYEIDLFQALIKAAAELTATADLENKSLRVIADHIRACSFLIVDGVLPSNEGRGYVLRRIIRRALRHGWMLGVRESFFYKMVASLVAQMGEAYPELRQKQAMVEAALKAEEERFAETLSRGMERFAEYARLGNRVASKFSDVLAMGPFFSGDDSDAGCYIRLLDGSRLSAIPVVNSGVAYIESAIDLAVDLAKLDHADHVITLVGDVEALQSLALDQLQSRYGVKIGISANSDYPVGGHAAFVLYDTYGFPVDLTADMARERGLSVDMAGFDAAMAQQREQARAASKFAGSSSLSAELVASLNPTVFLGYEHLQSEGLRVLAIVREGQALSELRAGEAATLILDRTPFYAESGGQVGDHGRLLGSALQFDVADTLKLAGVYFGHVGTLAQGVLKVGDALCGEVDSARRQAIVLNHSATHLLHAALREVLGDHVAQKGSQVAPERLRFDFSHFQPMTGAELAQVEALVNAEIRRNVAVEVHHMGMQEALDVGAMALFGEKYGEEVRVLKMGAFSTELCGGTHASRTGDIGVFKIVSEGGVASGVRRIEAVSGAGALAYIREEESRLDEVADLLGASATDVAAKLRQLLDRQRQLEKAVEQFKAKSAAGAAADLAASATDVGGFKLVAARLEGLDVKGLRDAVDNLKQKLPDAVILLASASEGKASLIAGVNGAALGKVKAGDVVGFVAAQINGKGGGRPDMAQGGGEDGPALQAALQVLPTWVAARLA